MSPRWLVLALLGGCAVENTLNPIAEIAGNSSSLSETGMVVHVGLDEGMACAFSTGTDGNGADVSLWDEGEAPPVVTVFDNDGERVLLALDGVLSELNDYLRVRRLGLDVPVVDAVYTPDGWTALTADGRLVARGGVWAAAPGGQSLERHGDEVWLRGRNVLWPVVGVTVGEPLSVVARYVDPDEGVWEAHADEVVGPTGTYDHAAVELFAYTGGVGVLDANGQVWRIDLASGEEVRTGLHLQPGSVTTSGDGWVLVHQTDTLTAWYGR